MKKFNKIVLITFFAALSLSSCDDMLEVNSERLVFEQDYGMNNTNDTLYSMFGVFYQLQKVADSYVILGELRGDLMTTTENSSIYLREIENLNISSNNPYLKFEKELYGVINNCNYIINNIDTAYVKGGIRVMEKEFAACKAIRAWSYMQLMLNFGEVVYYTDPILKTSDLNKNYTKYTDIAQLAPVLIQDIQDFKDTDLPSLGNLASYNSKKSYFPVRFLLGDLYLWTGQYEAAANEYRDLMYENKVIVSKYYRSKYEVINNEFTGNLLRDNTTYANWYQWLDASSSEMITNIMATNQYDKVFALDSLTNKAYELAPSPLSMQNWAIQQYFEYYYKDANENVQTLTTTGDLRSFGSHRLWSFGSSRELDLGSDYILKYTLLNPSNYANKQIVIYRAALLYLRYAEAVNRMGKPNLAFAVLKNGLSATTISNVVPAFEKDSILPNYMNFTDARFNENLGIRMRACGNVNVDTTFYVIPDFSASLNAKEDSILFVEDMIEQELALETAFEGNRFHDLMRLAIRRNDNAFLADKVSSKHTTNAAAIKTKLMNRSSWYLR